MHRHAALAVATGTRRRRHDTAGGFEIFAKSRVVTAAVRQPLAVSPPNIVWRAASSLRWNGCVSTSAPKAL
jgi:hypothetical protein